MIRYEDVSLLRIQQFAPAHIDAHATPAQPKTGAERRPRIDDLMLVNKPGDDENRWADNAEQRPREKQRPPVTQSARKSARPPCVRLLRHSFVDCSSLFHQF